MLFTIDVPSKSLDSSTLRTQSGLDHFLQPRKRESCHMTKLFRNCLLAASVLGLAAPSAFAQVPGGPIVGWDIGDTAVPIGSWVAVGLTLVISALAAWALQGRRRLASVVVAACAFAAGAGLLVHSSPTEAVVSCPTETSMVTSPTIATFCGAQPYTFRNNAGRSIIIRSLTLSTPGSYFIRLSSPTSCLIGSALAAGAACIVQVDNTPA